MNSVTVRILFAGVFGLMALAGGIIIQATGNQCPEWLVATIGAAAGYVFGHVQANGVSGKH